MKNIHLMIKPASSLCNMRCKYCFYADVSDLRSIPSYGMMSEQCMDAMLKNVFSELEAGDGVHFIFQGGEPTLRGLDFFRAFVARVSLWHGIRVSYALQTNGILLNEEWCDFLKEHRFLVGVSFDLLSDAHDSARVRADGSGTSSRVLACIALLKKKGVDFNVLCTLTQEVARHPQTVWKQICKLGLSYVQFTPCMAELDGGDSHYSLTPERFSSFYIQLFGLWYAAFQRGERCSVKLFDDVVNLMLLGKPTACGMNGDCQLQLVVEADGSVYPCDFYCLDEYKMGNITKDGVRALLGSSAAKTFLERAHTLPTLCEHCRYRRFCGGGCRRMRREIFCADGGTLCGYQRFLDACGGQLSSLAAEIRRVYFSKS
ncbi:MAG: SPASM domain-containing protein [Ruminococcaceae bacterium]|nr:SPASM domain-containing protein [Oscillospiraceae bacterium]